MSCLEDELGYEVGEDGYYYRRGLFTSQKVQTEPQTNQTRREGPLALAIKDIPQTPRESFRESQIGRALFRAFRDITSYW